MSVAKNIEITSTSPTSFEEAIESGIARASRTVDNVRGAWIKEQKINIENGRATEYQVTMILTFVLDGGDEERKAGSGGAKSGKGKKGK
jgi:flavin-binding protein dodecin